MAKNKRKDKRHIRKRGKVSSEKVMWMKQRADELNKNLPKSELWFLEKLKDSSLNIKFVQNFVCFHYIIDFRFQELAIEVDGSIHDNEDQKLIDRQKTHDLEQLGFTVIRIKAFDPVSLKSAIKKIKYYLSTKKDVRKSRTELLNNRIKKATKTGKFGKVPNTDKLSSNTITTESKNKRKKNKNKKVPKVPKAKSCMGCHKKKATNEIRHSKKLYYFCDKCHDELQKARKMGLI